MLGAGACAFHGCFCSTVWLLSGSAWQKQTTGEERVNQSLCKVEEMERTQSRREGPCLPRAEQSALHSLQPSAAPGPSVQEGTKTGGGRASPGPSSALTDSSTVLHCWHQGHRNQFFCLLPSRLIFPQLHDASCGDGWMTAVSGPYHHRECENAVRHQRSCSVSALCAGSSTLRRKKVHLCAGHASVSWTPEPGPQHRQGPSTHRSLKNPLFGRARGCGQYQLWPLQKVCPW